MQEPIGTQDEVDRKLKMINAHLDRMADLHFHPFSSPAQNEIDMQELWNAIWKSRMLIAAVTAIFTAAFIFLAASLPNIYRSQALIAPSDDAQGGGISRIAGQLGGLASLAGINLGASGGSNKISVALEVLQSRDFLNGFIERHHILPELMAVKRWDSKNNNIIYDGNLYASESKKWVRVVDFPRQPEPSSWEAYKAFRKILTVSQAKETGFVTVAIEHQSPFLAQKWVEMLVKDINAVMKSEDMAEAKRSIEFLQNQLAEVSVADMRTVFYQLIEEQMKTMMLAEIRDEYIFFTIDHPVVAEERTSPNRVLICVLGFVLGGMVGVIIVLGRRFFKNKKSSS